MSQIRQGVVITLAAIVMCASPALAFACTCAFPPRHEFVVGAAIPQNGGFILRHDAGGESLSIAAAIADPVVEAHHADGTPIPVTKSPFFGNWQLAFEGLVAGESITVTSTSTAIDPAVISVDVPVGDAVSPDDAIDLTAGDLTRTQQVIEDSGACASLQDFVFVDVDLVFPPELEPFAGTLVSHAESSAGILPVFTESSCADYPISGSAAGWHTHRVWVPCDEGFNGSPAGPQEITVTTRLPGSDLEWTSSTMVDVSCPIDGPGDDDSGDEGGSGCSSVSGRPAFGALLVLMAGYRRSRRRRQKRSQAARKTDD